MGAHRAQRPRPRDMQRSHTWGFPLRKGNPGPGSRHSFDTGSIYCRPSFWAGVKGNNRIMAVGIKRLTFNTTEWGATWPLARGPTQCLAINELSIE